MNRRLDNFSRDLFDASQTTAGALGCRVEIAATMAEALAQCGLSRAQVADKMGFHLGEKFSEATLNGYVAPSHGEKAEAPRDVTLQRAMAFDAALGSDVLLSLYARKRGERQVMNADDAALLEWARLHHEERELAERRRALEVTLKMRGRK